MFIPSSVFFGQLLIGLINGALYALLSVGLAVIFGVLRIVNFAHGAQYMMGAVLAWAFMAVFDWGYWTAIVLVPLLCAASGVVLERVLIFRLYKLDHLYGLVVTFGLALILQGLGILTIGNLGQPYAIPEVLQGGVRFDVVFIPYYRLWVIVVALLVCLGTWYAIERTLLGARLRASTENPAYARLFGLNVPKLMTFTYAGGVALAGLSGVMAAPIYQVSALMGAEIITVVFAVVVIGGMGSILGSIVAGFGLGIIEGMTRALYPEASSMVVFFTMAVILLLRPNGLFGLEK